MAGVKEAEKLNDVLTPNTAEVNHFNVYKEYRNGGSVQIMEGTDKTTSDYKPILTIARQLAEERQTVQITAKAHYKSQEYKDVFGKLIGTKYERKCPDLIINGEFYEYEGYLGGWSKTKLKNMLTHGLKQSKRIIINNSKGCSDRFIKKLILLRIKDKKFAYPIEEAWVYEKGVTRRIW